MRHVAGVDPAALLVLPVNHALSRGVACSAQDLKEVMKKLLLAFYGANRHHKPERLIFYRDGVSEGQARLRPCWP